MQLTNWFDIIRMKCRDAENKQEGLNTQECAKSEVGQIGSLTQPQKEEMSEHFSEKDTLLSEQKLELAEFPSVARERQETYPAEPNPAADASQEKENIPEESVQIKAPEAPPGLWVFNVSVSSGPRHQPPAQGEKESAHLRELGEDAGGMLVLDALTAFWLADGRSDDPNWFLFSSRRLAQDVGDAFSDLIVAAAGRKAHWNCVSGKELLKQAVQLVGQRWQETITNLWTKNPSTILGYIGTQPLDAEGYHYCDWSTTLIVGFVSHAFDDLQIASAGDCSAIVYHIKDFLSPLTIDPCLPNEGRIFMRMRWLSGPDPTPPSIVSLMPEPAHGSWKRARAVICFTDGATRLNPRQLAKELPQPSLSTTSTSGADNALAYLRRMRQCTYDDRGVVYGRRLIVEVQASTGFDQQIAPGCASVNVVCPIS